MAKSTIYVLGYKTKEGVRIIGTPFLMFGNLIIKAQNYILKNKNQTVIIYSYTYKNGQELQNIWAQTMFKKDSFSDGKIEFYYEPTRKEELI